MPDEKPVIRELRNGRYRVREILGAGGFGVTYLCQDVPNNQLCAIKEYLPEAIAVREAPGCRIIPQKDRMKEYLHGKKRFFEEALLLMKLKNLPSMVKVWEVFEENNTAYYAMEYLSGKTVKQLMAIAGGRLPWDQALDIVRKTGIALDRMHRQAGVFHRDISPENIMVMPDDSVKIIDFGSAKMLAISENQQFSIVLKPGFAPPEQYSGKMSQGSFTDVYALAGTFYYAASGKKLPAAPNRLMGEKYQPLGELVPRCSQKISHAVDKALALSPQYRTQTMAEFVAGLSGKEISQVKKDISISARMRQPQQSNLSPAQQQVRPAQEKCAAARIPPVWLLISAGVGAGNLHPLTAGKWISVGRSREKSQIVIAGHREISGLHFLLFYDAGKHSFYIIDKSVNGLYYQNRRLEKEKKYRIQPNTELGVGSMRCRVILGVEKNGR